MSDVIPGLDALPRTSAMALDIAGRYCGDDCRSYHSVWGLLRLLGNLPAVASDHAFLTKALNSAIENGARRVLVSGSADHGLVAYVLAAFEYAGIASDVTVIDRCGTPLAVCESYASEVGHKIQTSACDALTYADRPYDLIVAHNFLNFFSPSERTRLVANWYDLLNPGGRVISVSTLKPGAPDQWRRFGSSDADSLADRMCTALTTGEHAHLFDEGQVRELITDYAARRTSWNLQSVDMVVSLFEQNGFDMFEEPDLVKMPAKNNRIRAGFVAARRSMST